MLNCDYNVFPSSICASVYDEVSDEVHSLLDLTKDSFEILTILPLHP